MKYSYTSSTPSNSPPKNSVVTEPEDSASHRPFRSRFDFRQFLKRFKSNRTIMRNMKFYGFETIRATNGYMKSNQKRSKKVDH